MKTAQTGRVDWVDYGKGFCIVMVVMMHSTLGVEAAAGREGWLHHAVAFALPFRMPDFFLISGLFLANVIDRPWRAYLDRKVVHFAYFYLLWMTIQFAVKAPVFVAQHGAAEVLRLYVLSLIDPFGTLWFIYMLPVFFVFIRLTRRIPIPVLWLFGAALEMAHIDTGWMVPDEFAARFVYCYTGYIFAKPIFALAARVQLHPLRGLGGLSIWALLNGSLVYLGYEKLPLVSLALGLVGACAVISAAALMAKAHWLDWLRYCGQNSIVIYLAFFLPMAATRTVLLKTGVISDIGTISALVTLAGVIGAMVWFWAARGTRFGFLFERPAAFWLAPPKHAALQPAE